MEASFRRRHWTCRQTDYRMNDELCFSACFTYVLVITGQPTYSAKYNVATARSQVITNCHLQVVIKYCFLKNSPYIVFYLVILFCAVFPYSKCVLSYFFLLWASLLLVLKLCMFCLWKYTVLLLNYCAPFFYVGS